MKRPTVTLGALVSATVAAVAFAAVAAVAFAVPSPDRGPSAAEVIDVPAGGELDPPAGDPELIALLSGIDFVPSKAALDTELGPTAEQQLIAIARTGSPTDDPGVRIRAYRALALYSGSLDDLKAAVTEHGDGLEALDNLYLRAAMDALATVAGPDLEAVDDIAAHLSHASRDVRAAAARALATTGALAAVERLRARLPLEPEEQVKAAISKAIRALDSN